jgi:hypothetical protein
MCCKLLVIEELQKDAGVWCGHYKRGCTVYEHRPAVCRGFHCVWLKSERLGPEWRPDRAKFLMYTERDDKRLNVIVDPAHPLAWKREPYYSFIKRMSQRVADGHELLVCVGDRRIAVFPEVDVDLGLVNPEHKIVFGYARQEGGHAPYAMVLSDLAETASP